MALISDETLARMKSEAKRISDEDFRSGFQRGIEWANSSEYI